MTTTDFDSATALEQLLAGRHSCRGFLDTPIPRAVWDRLLTMAQRSPSWCNTQPWELLITEGAATERLRAALSAGLSEPGGPDLPFPPGYSGVHQQRRRECARQLYDSVGVEQGDRAASQRQTMRNFDFFGAPSVIILTSTTALGPYGVLDCGVYLGHLLTAAHSLGLGTIAQAALALYSPLLRSHFDLPADRQIVCGVSLGYADPQHPANAFRTERAEITQVATFHSR